MPRLIVKQLKFSITTAELVACIQQAAGVAPGEIADVNIARRGMRFGHDSFCSAFVSVNAQDAAMQIIEAMHAQFFWTLSTRRIYVEPAVPRMSWMAASQAGNFRLCPLLP